MYYFEDYVLVIWRQEICFDMKRYVYEINVKFFLLFSTSNNSTCIIYLIIKKYNMQISKFIVKLHISV